jgi:hypothetical protein
MRDDKDRLTAEDLRNFVAEQGVYTYVETGTAHGEQLMIAKYLFPDVIGIELDPHNAALSAKNSGCMVIEGKSEDILPKLHLPGPVCFYLDAHYCHLDPPIEKSHFPLWEELNFIGSRDNEHDIIIVDDVHTFGKERPDLKFDDGCSEWEVVTEGNLIQRLTDIVDADIWEGEIIKDCFVMRRKDV